MAVTNNFESTCQNLGSDIREIRNRIEILDREISNNQSTLNRGIENRIRMRIQNGQLQKVPTYSEEEIRHQTQQLKDKIDNDRNELRQLEQRRNDLLNEFRSLDCSKWVSLY
jgi:uncharacterized coiled-coil DUF342 family protein